MQAGKDLRFLCRLSVLRNSAADSRLEKQTGGASAPIRYGRLFRRIRREEKSPSVRSYIPYTPADA